MKKANTSPGSAPCRYGLSTDEFAAQHRVLAQSIRKQLWATGLNRPGFRGGQLV